MIAVETILGVAQRFAVDGAWFSAEPLVGGHINASWIVSSSDHGALTRCVLQRVNTRIFREPAALIHNILRVTSHVRESLQRRGAPEPHRRSLALVPTRERRFWHAEADAAWRMYRYIEDSHVRVSVTAAADARTAGRAFGEFQCLLADLPPPRLHETLPHFHDTPTRFAALEQAMTADLAGRRADVPDEVDFALARRTRCGTLVALHDTGLVPERVVHNDAKMSNVLLDVQTDEALCVVDLDTVMPGLSLYDFGDMVRSMTCTSAEDEVRLDRVEIQPALFAALAEGYLESMHSTLTPAERAHLVAAGEIITLEQGVRFLADHLNGDAYYAIERPGQNLDRARVQFALLESIERHRPELERLAARR